MNEAQQEDLFIEWSLYEDLTRKAMVTCTYKGEKKLPVCEQNQRWITSSRFS